MSEAARSRHDGESVTGPALPPAVRHTGLYEEDDNVVLFDETNPLAWVEGDAAVTLTEWA